MASIKVVQVRGGKNPSHVATFGQLEVEAASAAQARSELSMALLDLASESLEPVVVMPYPGEAFAVVWRSPRHGWTYTIRQPDNAIIGRSAEDRGLHDHADRMVITYYMGLTPPASTSRDGAEREARTHLAQWLYRPGRSTAWVAHPERREDALRMEAWQRAYRRGQAAGAVDPWAYANHEGARGFPDDPGEEVEVIDEMLADALANSAARNGPYEEAEDEYESVGTCGACQMNRQLDAESGLCGACEAEAEAESRAFEAGKRAARVQESAERLPSGARVGVASSAKVAESGRLDATYHLDRIEREQAEARLDAKIAEDHSGCTLVNAEDAVYSCEQAGG